MVSLALSTIGEVGSMRTLAAITVSMLICASAVAQEVDTESMIDDALSAAPPEIGASAAVHDWNGNVLRGGYSDWICYPTPPGRGDAKCPMCLDSTWRDFVKAQSSKSEFKTDSMGVAYMLAGDCPVSNTDPNAEGPSAENQWINAEGPHLMIIVPDTATLEGMSTDPYSGRPYVMWKGTSYAHIMVPTAGNHPHHKMGAMMHHGPGRHADRHGKGAMMQESQN